MNKVVVFAMFALALGVGTTIAMFPSQDRKQTKPKVHEQHDKSTYPVADYEVADPPDVNLRALRKARARRHNVRLRTDEKMDVRGLALSERSYSSWGGPPTHADIEPALPATQSDVVVVGEVTDTQAFLSEDKTSIYSEFTVRTDEILKNNTAVTLVPGSSITTIRTGGAVRFPSGKVIQRGFGGKPFPLTKRRYVFFLTYEREEQDYPIITAYELRAGLVYPLDGLDIDGTLLEPYARYHEYKGWNEATFLNKVREAVVSSGDSPRGLR